MICENKIPHTQNPENTNSILIAGKFFNELFDHHNVFLAGSTVDIFNGLHEKLMHF